MEWNKSLFWVQFPRTDHIQKPNGPAIILLFSRKQRILIAFDRGNCVNCEQWKSNSAEICCFFSGLCHRLSYPAVFPACQWISNWFFLPLQKCVPAFEMCSHRFLIIYLFMNPWTPWPCYEDETRKNRVLDRCCRRWSWLNFFE